MLETTVKYRSVKVGDLVEVEDVNNNITFGICKSESDSNGKIGVFILSTEDPGFRVHETYYVPDHTVRLSLATITLKNNVVMPEEELIQIKSGDLVIIHKESGKATGIVKEVTVDGWIVVFILQTENNLYPLYTTPRVRAWYLELSEKDLLITNKKE